MRQEEAEEQKMLMVWSAMNMDIYPELEWLHHIPNGGKRDARTGAQMKREGVKAGVPDLCLPVPSRNYHGLYIELKKSIGGRTTVNQKKWLSALKENGYRAVVCYGWRHAAEEIENYLGKREGSRKF